MKTILILLIFSSTLFAQEISEIKPSEKRKIKTEFTKEYIENYNDEFGGNPWSKPFQGCSWYCGGRIDSIKSSTKCNYLNNDDDKLKNIEYVFNEKSAKFTEIVIVNGNVKNDSLWNEYSRAKKIKMYINDKEFKTLILEDTKDEQIFKFQPIGAKTKPKSKNKNKQWNIRFEIIEYYPGNKQNVAISEIYFEGDGHDI